jgi:hypothetical protein
MTRAFISQTNFSAGELDPRMLGRTDLRAFENGAAKLRNVVVETTGGVRRRPGMAYVASAAGPGRLVDLEIGPGLGYLLAFSDFQVDVFRDAVLRVTVATPWSEEQLAQMAWAQFGDSLLVTHPDVPPQQLKRESDTVWTIAQWAFAEVEPGVTAQPFARFAERAVQMQSSGTTGTVTLSTSADVFVAAHLGGIVRMKGQQIELTNIQTSTQAIGLVLQPLLDTGPTTRLGRASLQRGAWLACGGVVPSGSYGDRRLARPAEWPLAVQDRRSLQFRCRHRPGRRSDRVPSRG